MRLSTEESAVGEVENEADETSRRALAASCVSVAVDD